MSWSADNWSDMSRWWGTGATVLGAAVVAPRATFAAFTSTPHEFAARWRSRLIIGWRWVRRAIFRRRTEPLIAHADAASSIALTATVTGQVTRTPPETGTDERLTWLETQVQGLWHHCEGQKRRLNAAISEVRAEAEHASQAMGDRLARLSEKIDKNERQGHQLNTKAFPVIALGAVLGGLSDELSGRLWLLLPILVLTTGYGLGALTQVVDVGNLAAMLARVVRVRTRRVSRGSPGRGRWRFAEARELAELRAAPAEPRGDQPSGR